MTYTKTAPAITTTTPKAIPVPSLATRLQAALEHARRLTEMRGTADIEVAIAWETVEELQVAWYRHQQNSPTYFEQYCVAHPDAPECRIYED
ncbi:Calvin cycle protein CP12 [Halomicronema sp. CCY15110]|uniref:Calvin cycle protein CP12 n=1 Tax=Halomicronema sp. CCY15110 TaxID=2767773 RepID=UPI00194E8066|nr:Calvin cycle protein CP12 [Halomicronema sp. CCY15110]